MRRPCCTSSTRPVDFDIQTAELHASRADLDARTADLPASPHGLNESTGAELVACEQELGGLQRTPRCAHHPNTRTRCRRRRGASGAHHFPHLLRNRQHVAAGDAELIPVPTSPPGRGNSAPTEFATPGTFKLTLRGKSSSSPPMPHSTPRSRCLRLRNPHGQVIRPSVRRSSRTTASRSNESHSTGASAGASSRSLAGS